MDSILVLKLSVRPTVRCHWASTQIRVTLRNTMMQRATKTVMCRAGYRAISSTPTRYWEEVKTQRHANDLVNPHLNIHKTVAVIGAPMTCR